MVGMITIPHDRTWTRDDLAALPEDGNRYEILDGALLVTPSPSSPHQFVILGLYDQLKRSCPRELRIAVAPLDVVLDESTVLQPDVLVAHRDRVERWGIRGHLALAVEVLSPSTRRIDLTAKLRRYERAGIPAYWVADPDELTLTAYELSGAGGPEQRYHQVAHVTGEATWTARTPYEVAITPSRWLD